MPDGLQMQFYIFFDELWQTADAGLVLFAGASFFVIMLHASTYVPQEAAEGFDLEMDGIQTVWDTCTLSSTCKSPLPTVCIANTVNSTPVLLTLGYLCHSVPWTCGLSQLSGSRLHHNTSAVCPFIAKHSSGFFLAVFFTSEDVEHLVSNSPLHFTLPSEVCAWPEQWWGQLQYLSLVNRPEGHENLILCQKKDVIVSLRKEPLVLLCFVIRGQKCVQRVFFNI